MKAFTAALMESKDFRRAAALIDAGGCPLVFSGLESIHMAHFAAAVRAVCARPVVVVCSDELECERLRVNLSAFSGEDVRRLLAREFTFYNAESVSRQLEQERLSALGAMVSGTCSLFVATPDALMQRTVPPKTFIGCSLTIAQGDTLSPETLVASLLRCGYKHSGQVEGIGQFARRGGIIDFFSPAYSLPVRCEFFGDEIDLMGFFDPASQRRTENITEAAIFPAAETLPTLYEGAEEGFAEELQELLSKVRRRKGKHEKLADNIKSDLDRLSAGLPFSCADRYFDILYPEFFCADSFFQKDTVVLLCEPIKLEERAKNYIWRISEDTQALLESGVIDGSQAKFIKTWEECCERLSNFPVLMLDSFRGGKYPLSPRSLLSLSANQLPSYGGSLSTAAGDIIHYMKNGFRVIIACTDERRCAILGEYLENTGVIPGLDYSLEALPPAGNCVICVGGVSSGIEYPTLSIALITEGQLAAHSPKKSSRSSKASKNKLRIQSYSDLSVGDAVVHELHGIGRFMGIFKLPVDGVEKEYVKIAYSGTDVLYVPATQLDMVSKYIGAAQEQTVKLSKLGGTDWAKAKAKAKGAAKELASELVRLYAERSRRPGHAFAPDTVWQREFEDSFEYTETDDQLRAVEEIKADMEKTQPMDRLLCGDVGFGKTEVALRAVMKCVMGGRQAAILVPTTVLAQQHFITASKRFANFPVSIEVLSRFRTSAQIRQSLKNIKSGMADLVIGTHRIIQKDVEFKDLGLLIVDEEQRFGVSHKEKLKELSRQTDVLSLSPTPIPRTLNMALAGLRDMSTIEEPPSGRHPVQTYVLEHNWSVLTDAIRREISRGGQVYYLHNRVETIGRTAARLSQLLEGITIATAHGQMDEETLSGVMERVASGEVQVLICTTIIETGIDIPNVNTLIIEDADKLGLAQLHQIRGRVGRSSRHAFAYFTFRQGKVLTEVAMKRLATIREYAEFNSGFRIAMRDLEIRGAGNLLGAEQSGHMLSVGFDMYLKLLEEAVLEEKGETPKKRVECSADLTVSAGIPDSYIASAEQRMDLYRRIAFIEDEEDADDMTDELIDRFGDPPKPVVALIQVALLRGEAAKSGITEINQKGGRLYFKITDFDMERISALYASGTFKGRLKIEAGTEPVVSIKLSSKNVIDEAVSFVREYRGAIAPQKEKGS